MMKDRIKKINYSIATFIVMVLFLLSACSSDPYKASGIAEGLTGKYVGPVFGYEIGDPLSVYPVEVLPSSDSTVILRSSVLEDLEVVLREKSENEVVIISEEFTEAAFFRSTNRLFLDKRRTSAFVFNGILTE